MTSDWANQELPAISETRMQCPRCGSWAIFNINPPDEWACNCGRWRRTSHGWEYDGPGRVFDFIQASSKINTSKLIGVSEAVKDDLRRAVEDDARRMFAELNRRGWSGVARRRAPTRRHKIAARIRKIGWWLASKIDDR